MKDGIVGRDGAAKSLAGAVLVLLMVCNWAFSQTAVRIDLSPQGRRQVIDGFGTCIGGNLLLTDPSMRDLYYQDLGGSIVRMDLVPRFIAPYSDNHYNSPFFFHSGSMMTFPPDAPANSETAGGPDHNNVRTYTGPEDYSRDFGGMKAPIAVMGPDINANIQKMNFGDSGATALIEEGMTRKNELGDLKVYGSLWSPAPWVKVANGELSKDKGPTRPKLNTPYPFVWNGNFAGGSVDVSGKPLDVFNDGTGPTSSLQQFARCLAATLKGYQDKHGFRYYGISIQNELNFPEYYNSCTYEMASQYITALKAVKAELAKYDDLKDIRIIGPEDLLGGNAWGMWQYHGKVNKNLKILQALSADPDAMGMLDLFCVHGYALDGGTAIGNDPQVWLWWANGWRQPPARGLPDDVKGFTAYQKRSWMTESSGEQDKWLSPATGAPRNGGFSIALKMHHALTAGQESACIYWQFADREKTTTATLTGADERDHSPKYVAAKHFYKFIRPNAVRVDTRVVGESGVLASAYVHDANHTLTIVLVNTSSRPQEVVVELPSSPMQFQSFQSYTSDAQVQWRKATASVDAGKTRVQVPGYGVVTLFGHGS